MDRNKIERFFKDRCTPAEIEEVKAWFKTPEGQDYLKQKLDQDISHLQDGHIKPMISEIRSGKMWDIIDAGVGQSDSYTPQPEFDISRSAPDTHRPASERTSASYWKAAAAVILLLVTSMFYVWHQVPMQEDEAPAQPISYTAGDNQQRALTLSDGTKIRLNSNAQIWIPEDFNRSTREVTLEGEAFFEVSDDDEKPFVVHTDRATIKDLGTAFNVRAVPDNQNVQVAVTDGKVSVWSDRQTEEKATELIEGQFGHLNFERKTLQVDQFNVDNYLSWMSGRLKYEGARLDQVSRQLSRMFDVSFAYSTHSLKGLTVEANFERKSLEKVLHVIAMTLHIDYRINEDGDGKKVIWLQKDQDSNKPLNTN